MVVIDKEERAIKKEANMENEAQKANLIAESQRIIARHEAGEYMHPDTLAMARAALAK